MKILRAEHLGMCFGVRDAIGLALTEAERGPLTILGELVHNETVLDLLRRRGIRIENQIPAAPTSTVMITAHGASNRTLGHLRERGLNVLQATCPLVHVAHRAVAQLVREGYHPVIIGKAGHVEVRGLTEDLDDYDLVLTEEDVARLRERPRLGVAAQTTQPIERVRHLVRLIQQRFPRSEVRFIDTVCQPTKQRQNAAVELAQRCDIVIVVGGAHSNNTRELVATCSRYCERVHHVQNADDVRSEWLLGAETIGLTAGTSTPDTVIDAVEARLREATFQLSALAVPVPENREHEEQALSLHAA
ncbi:MAG: 4-hydroxy-3-methylbut-2-enyl diphosphate reductase [Verrucomicrobia bacterium]|nr:4-hydroxy-3-methylbut-2-enyl diphosphate reductase [Verrucomicrobiota bacterium]